MRRIQVMGVSDTTYIGTNDSEYTLMLVREDGTRFVLPMRLNEEETEMFLHFAFAESDEPETAQPQPLSPSQPLAPQLEHHGELNEVQHSFAALDGEEEDDDDGPFGGINSI